MADIFKKLKSLKAANLEMSGLDPVLRPARRDDGEGDQLGAYPTAVRVPALEGRRYLWTTRVFAIGFYLSVILNIILVFTIFNVMLPLKRVEPFLVTFSQKDDQVVHIQPLNVRVNGIDVLIEAMAREFVRVREEILTDQEEMQRRWIDYLKTRMIEDDYRAFLSRVDAPFQELVAKGISRKVEIDRVIRRSANHLEVYYKTLDQDRSGRTLLTSRWVARLRIGFENQQVSDAGKYNNPLGFMVYDYSVSQN
jgi:type IV secretory pathway component VirB8